MIPLNDQRRVAHEREPDDSHGGNDTARAAFGDLLRATSPDALAAFLRKLEPVDRLLAKGQTARVRRAETWEDL